MNNMEKSKLVPPGGYGDGTEIHQPQEPEEKSLADKIISALGFVFLIAIVVGSITLVWKSDMNFTAKFTATAFIGLGVMLMINASIEAKKREKHMKEVERYFQDKYGRRKPFQEKVDEIIKKQNEQYSERSKRP